MSEREEARVRAELASALKRLLPDTLTNLLTAALIWLFGVLVYLPAAGRITPVGLPLACALILLAAFSVFIFKAFGGLRLLLEAASDILARRYMKWRKETEMPMERLRAMARCAVFIATALILYALYSPFLSAIHPSLAGLVLIPIVLWILLMLLRATTPEVQRGNS